MTPDGTTNKTRKRHGRPFPWRCFNCLKEEVYPATIPYAADIKHDGRMHHIEIPKLTIPKCRACGEVVFSNSADDQIVQALRAHLNLLTPQQIRERRKALGLKAKELAERLGVAKETLSRWETGMMIQSRAMDNLLRGYFAVPELRAVLGGQDQDVTSGTPRASANHLLIYTLTPAQSPRHFVEFWSDRYNDIAERRYMANIGEPHTSERLHALFEWKIGRVYPHWVERLDQWFISRRGEAQRLIRRLRGRDPVDAARAFLSRFDGAGAIWRIFWLHCWDQRFPIYDQHVHRAMTFIQTEQLEELPNDAGERICLYLDRYIPFFDNFRGLLRDIHHRTIDKGLWRFGLSLRDENLPPPGRARNLRRNRHEPGGS